MQSSISKYRITKRVGGGSFGDIYLGVGANGEKVRAWAAAAARAGGGGVQVVQVHWRPTHVGAYGGIPGGRYLSVGWIVRFF